MHRARAIGLINRVGIRCGADVDRVNRFGSAFTAFRDHRRNCLTCRCAELLGPYCGPGYELWMRWLDEEAELEEELRLERESGARELELEDQLERSLNGDD